MGKLILSAFADEFSPQFDKQLEGMKDFGIDYIEVRGVDGKNISELTLPEVKEIKKKADASGIGISAIGSPIGKIKLDGDVDAHFEMAKRVFESANILGADNIRMFSFYAPEGKKISEYKSEVYEKLGKLIDIAESFSVKLCHENEALIYGESPESCLEILNYFGAMLKCVFDMGNFTLDNYEPIGAYELLKGHIEYFHIKDALSAGAIVPPGCGEAKIKEILTKHTESTDKDTFITLEPHLQTFSGLNALVGKSFDNPYKYETPEAAFCDAVIKLKELLK